MNKDFREDILRSYYDGHLLWFESADTIRSGLLLSQFLDAARRLAGSKPRPKVMVLIAAGEANQAEYERGKNAFDALLSLPNVSLEMAAGPVLSGDAEGRSVVLELASTFAAFKAIYQFITRVDEHWKVVTVDDCPRLIQVEQPHRAVPRHACRKVTFSERAYFFGTKPKKLFYLDQEYEFDSIFEVKERKDGVLEAIPKHPDERKALQIAFETIARSKVEWFGKFYRGRLPTFGPDSPRNSIPVLSTKSIQSIEKWMRERGGSYDSANAAEILASLESIRAESSARNKAA